jgi:hypothetical protein
MRGCDLCPRNSESEQIQSLLLADVIYEGFLEARQISGPTETWKKKGVLEFWIRIWGDDDEMMEGKI